MMMKLALPKPIPAYKTPGTALCQDKVVDKGTEKGKQVMSYAEVALKKNPTLEDELYLDNEIELKQPPTPTPGRQQSPR